MMKGEATLKVLEYISGTAVDIFDLTIAVLGGGYGASVSHLQYSIAQQRARRFQKQKITLNEKRQRQRFYSIFSRLKRDGLIYETARDEKRYIALTLAGKRQLDVFKKRRNNMLPPNVYDAYAAKSSAFILVIFDIPEGERRKRMWLRSALRNLGFRCIQKSVWMGKVKIPKIFLKDLKGLHLLKYVEIFEISKTGSLRQLA